MKIKTSLRFAHALGAAYLATTALAAPAHAEDEALPASVAGIPTTTPESVGMSSPDLKRMDAYLDGLVKDGMFSGVSMVVTRHGKVFYDHSVGYRDIARKLPQTNDTIGRMYSMTKTITGVAMMMLWEEGKWAPEDPIAKYVPEFANLKVLKSMGPDGKMVLEEPDHAPTMGELMSHTAGFNYSIYGDKPLDKLYDTPAGRNVLFSGKSLQDMIDVVSKQPLVYQPGTRFVYSISSDIQAYIIEKLTGQKIEQFMKTRIFDPLGMKDTFYHVPKDKLDRAAVFYQRTEAGKLIPRENPGEFDGAFNMGGGGLWSTNDDYLRFAQMLANGGTLDGHRILGPQTVRFMTQTNMPDDVGSGPTSYEQLPRGMKFAYDAAVYTNPALAGCACGKGTFWWAGAGGTWYWVDPTNDITAVGFVQRLDYTGTTPMVALTTRPGIYQALVDPAK